LIYTYFSFKLKELTDANKQLTYANKQLKQLKDLNDKLVDENKTLKALVVFGPDQQLAAAHSSTTQNGLQFFLKIRN
jgi:hypothetical protein